MPDQAQGLINVARSDAQSNAGGDWGPSASQQSAISQDQATSDRLSSPNHRLSVTNTHPSAAGVTKVRALVEGGG